MKTKTELKPWTFAELVNLTIGVKGKRSGAVFRCLLYPDGAYLDPTVRHTLEGFIVTYEALAADYLQLDESVCGTEVEQ